MSTRLKRASIGFLTDIVGNFLLTATTLLVTPFILKLTSASLYGLWMIVLSILAYLGVVDLGMGPALVRLVIGTEHNTDAFNKAVSTAFFTFFAAGIIFLATGAGISIFIPHWFHIPPNESKLLMQAYFIAVISGAISLPLTVFGAIVLAGQRMMIVNIVKNSSLLFSIGLSILLLYAGFSILALAIAHLVGIILIGFINYIFALRFKPYLKIKLSFFNKADFYKLFSFGGYFQLGQIANMVAVNIDPIIIAAKIGVAAVTPYQFTARLAGIISITVASKLPGALFPAVSQMFLLCEKGKLKKSFLMLASFSSRLAIVSAFFLTIYNENFVSLWVGKEFYGGTLLNSVFVYWVIQDTIFRGTSMFIQASGDMRNWAIVAIIESTANITISFLLAVPLGLAGVALGTAIARTPSTIYIMRCICRKIDLSSATFVRKGILYPIFRSLPGCLISLLIALWIPANLRWSGIVLFGGIIVVLNLISFEGIEMAKPSELAFSKRLQQVIMRTN